MTLSLSILAACINAAQAGAVFAWDPSPEPNLLGYNLYFAESGGYSTKIPLGDQTKAALGGLEEGKTYIVYVTALSNSGQESSPSDPLIYSPGPAGSPFPPGPAPPQITLQPATQVLTEGQGLVLRVAASSHLPMSFQWHRNGLKVPGAVSDALLLEEVEPADAGAYAVLVQNSAGVSVSSAAQVVVERDPAPPPISLSASSLMTPENTPTFVERIDIHTSPKRAARVVLSAESLNSSLIPSENIYFGGTGSVRYFIMIPRLNQHGACKVLFRATLGESEISEQIEVTVFPGNRAPLLTAFPIQLDLISGLQRVIPLEISDPDGDEVQVSIAVSPPEFSQFVRLEGSGTDRSVRILTDAEQTGRFDLSVTVCDSGGLCASQICAVQIVTPTLSVERRGEELVIRWPSIPGLHLEASQGLLQSWKPAGQLPGLISHGEGECRLAWTPESAGLFFRLVVE